MQKVFIAIIGTLLLLTLFITGCLEENGQTTSEPGGEVSSSSIQDLINDASSGDTIIVPSGVYYENITIDKSITLMGEDKESTIIEGSVEISSDYVTLSYFTIKNGTGVSIIGSTGTDITNNVVTGSSGFGIYLVETSVVDVTNNVIVDNEEEGIYIYDSSDNTIYRNTIENNEYGIYVESSDNNTIYFNNFLNNAVTAYDDRNNSWDNETVGNYWSDYIDKYPDANSTNGVWNTPYNISGGVNNDSYPLVEIINEKPVVDFSYSPTSPSTADVVQFNDDSGDTDGYIIWWLWAFGDGNTSAQRNPTHRYLENGYYTVSLIIGDNLEETNTKTKVVSVLNVEPSASFTIDPESPNDLDNISFIDNSTDSDGVIFSWYWDFGDGNFSTGQNASHRFDDDGIYTVTLTVTDDDGASDVVEKNVNVLNVGPSASFSFNPAKPTIEDTVEFFDHSSDSDGEIVTWSWDFGDGTTSSEQNPDHSYGEGRVYTASLTVTDDDGASDSFTRDVDLRGSVIPSEDTGKGYGIILVIFFIFFIAIIVFVYYMNKKYREE